MAQASALVAVLAIAGTAAADPDPPIVSVDGVTADYTGDQHLGIESTGSIVVPQTILATPVTLNIHDLTSTIAPLAGREGLDFRINAISAFAPTLTVNTDASVHIVVSGARGMSVRSLALNPSAGQAITIMNGPPGASGEAGAITLNTGRADQSRAELQHQEALRDFYLTNVQRTELALGAITGEDNSAQAAFARDQLVCQFVGVQIFGACIPLPVDNETFVPLLYSYMYTQQGQYDYWNSAPSPVELVSMDPALSLGNLAAVAAESFGTGGRGGDITITNYWNLDTTGADGIGILAQSVATASNAPYAGGAVGVENHGDIITRGASAAAIFARSIGANSSAGGGMGGTVTITGDGDLTTGGDYAFAIYAASIGGVGTTNQDRGGAGGEVDITYGGEISTEGNYATGVYAISIGGAGAKGKDADAGVGGSNQQANPGARAGDGGAVEVTIADGSVVTTGDYASAVVVVSRGGEGGRGGSGNISHDGSWGGGGGDGGAATATNFGLISTEGHDAYGMLVQSLAGDGGAGGNDSGWFDDHGGAGGAAGGGFTVIATNWGVIETIGARSYGVLAQSIGGRGGAGGDASSWFGANPGRGGTAGSSECQLSLDCPDGGMVTVDNYGVIVTEGFGAYAVLAQSIGGGGGQGGDGSGWLGIAGGEGGDAGRGDTVRVTNYNWLETHGERAGAIVAQSIGGGGGNGGDATAGGPYAALAIGGNAGAGGAGYDVHVRNEGVILITGERSNAILAQSIGGGGGVGGSASAFSVSGAAASIAIGGRGGGGGSSDLVDVDNLGDIVTYGDFSNGIVAQSIGGGGGLGGSAYAFAVGIGVEDFALAVSVSVGGSGGDGGEGGNVTVDNTGSITTFDFNSIGIIAQSIGGGGGQGGASTAQAITTMAGEGVTFTMSFAIGGSGGTGADAGQQVDVVNSGAIFTLGDGSTGILAQSIGGGGGNGGDASTTTAAFSGGESSSVELNIAIGGSGGDGGDGYVVNVTNYGTIVTLGTMANAITAQSIGGGGGTGGAGDQSDLFEDVDIPTEPPDFGDGDDSGGDRRRTRDQFGQLQGQARNAPTTQGSHGRTGRNNSHGGGAQTISVDLGISVGGDGGGGGSANTVTVRNTGAIWTGGFLSSGVFAQSIGGGGGAGGGGTGSADGDVGLGAGIGGRGSGGGDGGEVYVYNTGSIATLQAMSYGIFAQSIGGGGGLAGVGSGEGDVQSGVNLSLGIGQDGGDGGIGRLVHVEQTGDIVTLGYASIGVFAQSVGGGGGVGGSAEQGTFASIGIGGDGGVANNGGRVEVILNGDIATEGDFAFGVFAQSVGGGGGLAGGVDTRTFSFNTGPFGIIPVDTGMVLSVGNFGIGGGGGAGGDGQDVSVTSNGDISTFGDGAHGIFAQSIGGGGGAGGSGGNTFPLAIGLAGSNGDGGTAGLITVTHTGDIRAWGDNSAGIYAQSMDGSGTGRGGNITITLNGGDVQGGGGDAGVGIFVSAGASNLIENRGGHISALSDIAIAATDGDDRVVNSGWISGSVGLGAGLNSFDNQQNGLFDSGAGVYLGAGRTLTNAGIVSPFAAHEIGTTTLVGDYVQTITGGFRVDVDFLGGPSDLLVVDGSASLNGAIIPVFPHVSDLRVGSFVTVLTADALTNNGISIDGADTLVLDFTSRVVGTSLQVGVARVGYDIGALAPPSKALADHFQALWEGGDNSGMDPIMDHLASLNDGGAYDDLLGQIYPYGAFNSGAQPVTMSQMLLSGMMSCPGAAGTSDLQEHACVWTRASQLISNQEATSLTPGYHSRTRMLMGGMQAEFAPDWFGGFSLAIGDGSYDSEGFAQAATDTYGVGAVLKRQFGDLVLSGGIEYARIEGDTVRITGFPALVDATSSTDSDILAARFRAAYTARFGEFYLRPSLDLDSYEINTDAFNEAGAGALNLHVQDSSQTITSTGLSIEAGFLYVQDSGTVVHPYVQAGVTQLSDDSLTALANFEGDPVGAPAFQIVSPIADETTNVRFGFEALFARTAIRLEYEERNGDSYRDYSFAAKLRVRF